MNQYDPNQPPRQFIEQEVGYRQPKKSHKLRTALIIVGVLFVGLVGCTALVGGAVDKAVDAPVTTAPATTTPVSEPTEDTADPTPAPKAKPTKPKLTAGQEQAIGSAQSYLSMTAFSRKGLIQQLSSDAGDGYSVADATFAVDYLKVNWNAQAVKAAKSYLSLTHFSRSGLIRQLESSAGDGFTHSQAVYGVSKAGL